MKKKNKDFGKILEIVLIVLTLISLIINALEYTNMIYSYSYDTMKLNNILVSLPFNILLWVDNVLIYLISIFYIVNTVKEKKNMLLKLSICIFSICTTVVCSNFIINAVAEIFGIF